MREIDWKKVRRVPKKPDALPDSAAAGALLRIVAIFIGLLVIGLILGMKTLPLQIFDSFK